MNNHRISITQLRSVEDAIRMAEEGKTAREIRDKNVYFIATAAAGWGAMERTMDALEGFTDCLPGAKVRDRIFGSGVYQKGEVKSTRAMAQAYEDGLNL